MKSPAKITTACIALAFGAWFAVSSAAARPPTVTTSPGYDRALAESRKALQPTTPPDVKAAPRKRSKRDPRAH